MLTIEKVMEYAEDAVKFYGAEHKSACQYVCTYVDEPACIVGQILFRHGVSLEALESMEGLTADPAIRRLGIEATDDARDLMSRMQAVQDSGIPWGFMLDGIKDGETAGEIEKLWFNVQDS